jgi:2-polyprenyl-3-methyl-5-hydroxy-6-metoxy-1,4-benzoquinol methylase
MKSELWDERYAKTDYLYSDRPNEFMKRYFEGLDPNGARVLLPGDGDGRNGLWLAKQGFRVEAFDYSKVASEKANRRAREAGLAYSSRYQDVNDWAPEKSQFDFVVIVFLHLEKAAWEYLIEASLATLKPGGSLIIQVFSKDQLGKTSGGPKDLGLLFEPEDFHELTERFDSFELSKEDSEIAEGSLHTGLASLISFKGLSKK